MDCSFTLCSAQDTVETVAKKMLSENSFFAVLTDAKNRYSGIVTANDLLGINNDTVVEPLVHKIDPVYETSSLTGLKAIKSDILPVVNMNDNVVGVVSLRSLIEYLPQLLTFGETVRSPGSRRPNQMSAKYTINDIVGQSTSILELKEQIIAAAKTKSTVLILGETGTGKELVAHAIHRLSNRRHNPFVRVNCAAIPDNLLESELFGYESGAFTGAMKGGQTGKFEMADDGTIFLDEIGDMPLALQAKILRVLQEKEIEKIGGRVPVPLNVRIIAATHQDLQTLVKENKFREDLYFRLHVIPIEVPPLRNHREDIPILTDYFLQKFSDELDLPKPKVDRDFLTTLVEYDWPGNVRELSNTMERTLGLYSGTLTVDKLPKHFKNTRTTQPDNIDEDAQLKRCADEAEREAILKALDYHKGNKLKVCDALGISRSSLYNKLKKYEIDA